ncbi:hypothetical protein [Streptomyces griseoaurantiacus]|uniref:hypothetical protein n=1 Tax=Streptomyces griseoaurantiacus TaxID=68213 RepID=UPI00345FC3EC
MLTLGFVLFACAVGLYAAGTHRPETRQVDLTVLDERPDGSCGVQWYDPGAGSPLLTALWVLREAGSRGPATAAISVSSGTAAPPGPPRRRPTGASWPSRSTGR